ncbi:GUN4 domain-containing protein [Rippkaea orientalis]|nr:GUN4 domain-containing protein [Rippkaea orientalis]
MSSDNPNQPEQEPSLSSLANHQKTTNKFIQGTAQTFIQWMPLLASGGSLISFCLHQEWLQAALNFPIMIVTVIWAAYTESFLKRLREVYEEKARKDVDNLMTWQQKISEALTETIRWQLAGTDDKYLKLQEIPCQDFETEGELSLSFIPQLNEVFVPLELGDLLITGNRGNLLPIPPGFHRGNLNPSEGISIWDLLKNSKQIPSYRHLVLLAWGGYGKTTLLRHVTYIYTQKKQERGVPTLLPVLLRLRDWQEKIAQEHTIDLATFIEHYHIPDLSKKGLSLPPNWAKNHLERGKMLILLDGFDEVRSEWRNPVSNWIACQIKDYRDSYFIMTSRPAGYKEFPQENQHFTGKLYIKKFTLEQQKTFIQRWYLCQERYARGGKMTESIKTIADNRTANLVEQLLEREELADLANNPLMLNMIATLHRSYSGEKLPTRRTELYRDILQLQLWDRPRIKKIQMLLPLDKSQQVLQRLALLMVQENTPQLDYEALINTITPYLNEVDNSLHPRDFIKQIEQVSELLVKKDESHEFAHLSFQGYLAAAEIQRTQQEDLLLQHWQEPWWKETILLYGGQLRNPSPFIRRLININTPEVITLAYNCLKETPRQLDPDVQDQLQLQSISRTVQNARYQKLEEFLKNQQFKEADRETYRVMLETVGKEEEQWLDIKDIDNFPCDDLRIIDHLWVTYSHGKFGFSVQKKIYMDELGGTREYNETIWNEFGDRVGWTKGGGYIGLEDELYELRDTTPIGHLPKYTIHRISSWVSGLGLGFDIVVNLREKIIYFSLLSRAKTCDL